MKFGELGSTQGSKDDHGESSEDEHSEETTKEFKKPRLGGSSESQKNDDNLEILEEPEGKTDHSEELAEEKVGDKDENKGLNEGDKILSILQVMHEDVPLEDPGPNPNFAIEDGGNGVAGKTQ